MPVTPGQHAVDIGAVAPQNASTDTRPPLPLHPTAQAGPAHLKTANLRRNRAQPSAEKAAQTDDATVQAPPRTPGTTVITVVIVIATAPQLATQDGKGLKNHTP